MALAKAFRQLLEHYSSSWRIVAALGEPTQHLAMKIETTDITSDPAHAAAVASQESGGDTEILNPDVEV